MTKRLVALESALSQRQEEIDYLKDSEAKLRDIILDKTGSQEVTDDDIRSNFLKLRRGVQDIVTKSKYFGEYKSTKQKLANMPKDSSKMEFYDRLSRLERKDRALRVRSRVFWMLNGCILGAKHFGLKQTRLQFGDSSKLDGERIGDALAEFEEVLIHAKGKLPTPGTSSDCETNRLPFQVPGPIIADWRVGTLKCVDHLLSRANRIPASRIVAPVVDDILSFLDPIIAPNITAVQSKDLQDDVALLCEDAYYLHMDMRASKEEYAIWTPDLSEDSDEGFQPSVERFAESFGVEGGKSGDGSDQIAYPLFGGLVKHPEYRGEGLTVLETAQVVMKRK